MTDIASSPSQSWSHSVSSPRATTAPVARRNHGQSLRQHFYQSSHHNHCSLTLSRRVFAIATFDSNGILERSEVRRDRQASDWTEAIFLAIGVKGLLDAALNHQVFRYAKVSGENHVAFLVRRRRRYVALLSEPLESWEDEAEIRACLRELGTGDLLAMMQSG